LGKKNYRMNFRRIAGAGSPARVLEFWSTDYYTWIYKTVLERPLDIGGILLKHKLLKPEWQETKRRNLQG